MCAALLTAPLLADWATCMAFVRATCAGRSCSHGHTHAQLVTESALLISAMQPPPAAAAGGEGEGEREGDRQLHLRRIVHVAMLHDVADHKYERTPGQLTEAVAKFVALQFSDSVGEQELCLRTIDAISFSKEKKRGMRWFEATLPPPWLAVRDIVSDADKLYAIGIEGLTRCWIYSMELMHQAGNPPHMDVKWCVDRAVEHADEKLLLLKDAFIVTPSGKRLAEPRHQDMVDILDKWRRGVDVPVSLDAPLRW